MGTASSAPRRAPLPVLPVAAGALLALLALLALVVAFPSVAPAAERTASERSVQRATSRQVQCTASRVARTRSVTTGTARRRSAPTCATALPVVAGGQDPAATRAITLGANVRGWRDGGALADHLETAKSDGTRTTRVDVAWDDAEPRPGVVDWTAYDERFRTMAAAGVRGVVLLDGTASWAGAERDYAADPAGFARFTARTVARYGRGGTFWAENPQLDASMAPVWFELWNEPYLPAEGVRRSPEAYGRLALAAARAGRAANPGVKFLVAGDTVVYDEVRGRWRDWFTSLFAGTPGLRGAVDGVALHPYFRGDPDDYRPRSSKFHSQFLRLDTIRTQLRKAGVGGLPWFVTELGSATCRDRASNYMCTTERGQAANFRETLALLRTRYAANVRAVLAYRAEDLDYGDVRGDYDAYGSFGMRRLDGSAKPVLADYRRALLAG